jgi:hypothetical protein
MPNLNLTLEQELRAERMKRELPNASRKDLEDMLYSFIKMNFILQNNLSQVFKWAHDAKAQQTD